MKNTQLLLINDMCGYGKVALSAMLPVLSHMGYRIHNLPTALVSDTLNYPKFYIHATAARKRAPRYSSTPSWATTANFTPVCPSPRSVS